MHLVKPHVFLRAEEPLLLHNFFLALPSQLFFLGCFARPPQNHLGFASRVFSTSTVLMLKLRLKCGCSSKPSLCGLLDRPFTMKFTKKNKFVLRMRSFKNGNVQSAALRCSPRPEHQGPTLIPHDLTILSILVPKFPASCPLAHHEGYKAETLQQLTDRRKHEGRVLSLACSMATWPSLGPKILGWADIMKPQPPEWWTNAVVDPLSYLFGRECLSWLATNYTLCQDLSSDIPHVRFKFNLTNGPTKP